MSAFGSKAEIATARSGLDFADSSGGTMAASLGSDRRFERLCLREAVIGPRLADGRCCGLQVIRLDEALIGILWRPSAAGP